jgi:hypothetical protein
MSEAKFAIIPLYWERIDGLASGALQAALLGKNFATTLASNGAHGTLLL